MIKGDKALLNKKMLRKRLIFIDEIISKLYLLMNIGNGNSFLMGFLIIILVDIAIVCWLYSNKGMLYDIESTAKVSIFTLVMSSSFSFITLLYFRYKDKKREYDKVKVEIYNEVLQMLYINNEIIKDHFISYIEKETNLQTIKKHPIYKLWYDIKHDYRGLLIDSLLNNYMKEIFDDYDEYFMFYKYAEDEIYDEITKVFKNNFVDTSLPRNCVCILFDCIYKKSNNLYDNLIVYINHLDNKKYIEIIDTIVNVVKSNVNYKKMIESYDIVKDLHQKAITFLQEKILNYYF